MIFYFAHYEEERKMAKNTFPYGFILLISIFLVSNLAFAQEKSEKSTLEAVGRGEVKIKPDMAYLTISVETTAKKASDAVRENAEKMRSVIDKLKSQSARRIRLQPPGIRYLRFMNITIE